MDWDPPKVCGNGHRLAYPNVQVQWTMCGCSLALGTKSSGHTYLQCRSCSWQWREGGCDELVDGYPIG
jgi:hypothetical protein